MRLSIFGQCAVIDIRKQLVPEHIKQPLHIGQAGSYRNAKPLLLQNQNQLASGAIAPIAML